MTVKMHSGGVSRSGSSRVAGADVVTAVQTRHRRAHLRRPDSRARRGHRRDHGRPAVGEARGVQLEQLPGHQARRRRTDRPRSAGSAHPWHRHPRRHRCDPARDAAQPLLSRVGVRCRPGVAVAAATGQTAKAHGLDTGVIAEGMPADLVVLGPITGIHGDATGWNALRSAIFRGSPRYSSTVCHWCATRSEQTPPPSRAVTWRGRAGADGARTAPPWSPRKPGCC